MNTDRSQSKIAKPLGSFDLKKKITKSIVVFHRDGGFVDPTPQSQNELKTELERVAKQYGGGSGVDMTKFPEFKFEDPLLDPVNQSDEKKK